MAVSALMPDLLILLVLGAVPAWPYSSGWGYYPSGTLGLIFLIILSWSSQGAFEAIGPRYPAMSRPSRSVGMSGQIPSSNEDSTSRQSLES